ncbi:MAG: cobalt transporter CbiM [Desulfobulbaceae bacterium]|nr:cobalt transporter CbiM [Desulfobulbaceae bacterium]
MHISEGVMSLPLLLGGGTLTTVGTMVGLKRLDYEHIMTTALLSSAFFVASLIHVPIGPGSIHLILNGLLGILLGWASVPAIAVALLLQALLFGYGGLTVLGVNTVIMAGPAITIYLLFGSWIRRPDKKRMIGSFLAGFLGVMLSALLLAAALIGTDEAFIKTAQIIVVAHLPVMIIEGLVTMFTVSFLARVQPDMLWS